MDKPKIRTLVAYPALVNDRSEIMLEDPVRISPRPFPGPIDLPLILDNFDGKSSLEDIAAAYLAKAGHTLPIADLKRLIQALDSNLMLESPRFAQVRAKMLEEWRKASQRMPVQAGVAYPKDAASITSQFNEYLKAVGGRSKINVVPQTPVCVMAPSVDPRSSAETYISAYEQLRDRHDIELFVILASAFHPMTYRFCSLRKDVVTPYGAVTTDRDFLQAVAAKLPFPLHADEWAHRAEYAIEYQVAFLQWLFGGQLKAKIAPILVGNLLGPNGTGPSPRQHAPTAAFLNSLRAEIARRPGKVCVIAGAELSHLGGRFGDQVELDEKRRKVLAERDRAMLQVLAQCDAEKFHALVVREKNVRRITGHGALYTMLAATTPRSSRLLRYGQFYEPSTNTVTTFASGAFYA